MEFSYHLRSVAADDITFSGPGLGGNAPCFIADYSPFGVQLDCLSRIFIGRRTITADKYRSGFNGMEKDDEVKGTGNSYDFGARMYDSRLGRWLSIDALAAKFPYASPYNFVLNSPVTSIDPDGKDVIVVIFASDKREVGHSAIAVANYRKLRDKNGDVVFKDVMGDDGEIVKKPVMEKTGKYTFYELGPQSSPGIRGAKKDVKPKYVKRKNIKEKSIIAGGISAWEGAKKPDAVIKFDSGEDDYDSDMRTKKYLDNLVSEKPKYNGCSNNCTDFVEQGLEIKLDVEIDSKEEVKIPILGKENVSTPNRLDNAIKDLPNANVIKDAGDKTKQSLKKAYKKGV